MNVRTVDASHGWRWIAQGILIFRMNPRLWVLLIAVLFAGSRVLLAIPLLGVIAVLVWPNFIAGLSHGAQALEQGKQLRLGYLASGFLKNAAHLITIGSVSLVGQLLMLMAMMVIGGDAISSVSKTLSAGAITPETIDAMRAAAPRVMSATIVGLGVWLPFLMAAWFAPLLVFFDDMKPWTALGLSLWACLKNALPLLVYGIVAFVPMMILTPLSLLLRQPDLGFWLLAPLLAPSVYVGYKDLFVHAPAPASTFRPG